jgi:hypothetical protein
VGVFYWKAFNRLKVIFASLTNLILVISSDF